MSLFWRVHLAMPAWWLFFHRLGHLMSLAQIPTKFLYRALTSSSVHDLYLVSFFFFCFPNDQCTNEAKFDHTAPPLNISRLSEKSDRPQGSTEGTIIYCPLQAEEETLIKGASERKTETSWIWNEHIRQESRVNRCLVSWCCWQTKNLSLPSMFELITEASALHNNSHMFPHSVNTWQSCCCRGAGRFMRDQSICKGGGGVGAGLLFFKIWHLNTYLWVWYFSSLSKPP